MTDRIDWSRIGDIFLIDSPNLFAKSNPSVPVGSIKDSNGLIFYDEHGVEKSRYVYNDDGKHKFGNKEIDQLPGTSEPSLTNIGLIS